MEAIAIHKFAKLSAQKGRLVADQIRGLPVAKALDILNYSPKDAAVLLKKVLGKNDRTDTDTKTIVEVDSQYFGSV